MGETDHQRGPITQPPGTVVLAFTAIQSNPTHARICCHQTHQKFYALFWPCDGRTGTRDVSLRNEPRAGERQMDYYSGNVLTEFKTYEGCGIHVVGG